MGGNGGVMSRWEQMMPCSSADPHTHSTSCAEVVATVTNFK